MITITKKIEEANAITHAGTFHADEVFSTVLLEKMKPSLKVARVVDITGAKKEAIIYDIGFGKYDHHQAHGAKYRENGIKYCSFGLLWKKYGMAYLKQIEMPGRKDAFEMIDKSLVEEIDAVDNGDFPKIEAVYKINSINNLIKNFNATWIEAKDNDDAFLAAVNFAKEIFNNEIRVTRSKILAKKKVEKALTKAKDTILILDDYLPYKDVLQASKKEINFVIFPSNRGGFAVNGVNKEKDGKELKIPFPKSWGGLGAKKLEKISGIKDVTFCHVGLFLAGAKTKEAAIELAEKAIKEYQKK